MPRPLPQKPPPKLNPVQFVNFIDAKALAGPLPAVCLFEGEEVFLQKQALDFCVKKVWGPAKGKVAERPWGLEVCFADELSSEHLARLFAPAGLFGERLVVVKNLHLLPVKLQEPFLKSLPHATRGLRVVLMGKKLDARTKFTKALKKHIKVTKGWQVPCKPLAPYEVKGWLTQRTKAHGIVLEPGALEMLEQLLPPCRQQIEYELLKLSTKKLTIKDTQNLNTYKAAGVFEFTKSLGQKRFYLALKQLQHLVAQGEHELALLALAARHIRLLVAAKQGEELTKVSPYFRGEYQSQAQKWTLWELKHAMQGLLELDAQLKRPVLPLKLYCEAFLLKLSALKT